MPARTGPARPRRTRLTLGVLAAAIALAPTACSKVPGFGSDSDSAPKQLWRSDGYGKIFTLQGDRLRSYETTSISCIPSDSLTSAGSPDSNGVQSFGEDGAAEVTLRPGPGGKTIYREIGTVSEVDLIPISALPATCGERPAKDPVTTFDVFWTTINENYNSLGRKNVDWVAMRDRYRPMINETTRDKQLFDIMRAMIEPFGDMHTGLTTDDDAEFGGKRPGTVELDAEKTDAAVDNFLLAQGASGRLTFGEGKLVYADLPNGRGYLRIGAFEELSEEHDDSSGEAEVNRMLNAVFTKERIAGLRMLVIDVRNNPGGSDALGIQIASRLTDRPYLAYTKSARNDPKDPGKQSRPQPVTVTPATAPTYTGRVRLLTGPLTISAGETFTLAMMGRTPPPERFGANTQGVYSDTLSRRLPNGWEVTIGNEEFIGPDGRSYEGPGIPPTTPIPVFPPAELAANQDSVLAAALR